MTHQEPLSGDRLQARIVAANQKLARFQTIGMIVLLPGLIWLTHFWHSASFGFYEDDITLIPTAVQTSLPALLKYLGNYIIHLYAHGHPLSDSFAELFSNLGWKMAGIQGAYLIGFMVLSVNAILFYLLLKRVADPSFAITGSFAYVLFSADTTQPFLIHSLGLQTSITFLLAAMHFYLSGRLFWSYLFILGALLDYETAYLVFLAVPMFEPRWDRAWLKRLIRHIIVLAVIMGLDVFLRSFNGESRVSDLTLKDILTIPVTHSIIGPVVAMGTYLYRPFQALRSMNLEIAVAVLFTFALFGGVLSRLHWDTVKDARQLWADFKKQSFQGWIQAVRRWSWPGYFPEALKPVARLAATGLAMLILAYPLTFTVRPYAISGRDTRVHLTGVVGAAILLASVIATVFYLVQSTGWKKVLNWGLALLLALLVGFGFVVQKDYSQAWIYERSFWSNLLPQISDITDGTVILIDPNGLKDTRQIGANTWNLPRVLDQIYTFPADWKNHPRVYRLEPGWQAHLVNSDGLFTLDVITTMAPPSLYKSVKSTDVILFDTNGGKLTRITSPLSIGGRLYPLKLPAGQNTAGFSQGFLYSYLIGQPK